MGWRSAKKFFWHAIAADLRELRVGSHTCEERIRVYRRIGAIVSPIARFSNWRAALIWPQYPRGDEALRRAAQHGRIETLKLLFNWIENHPKPIQVNGPPSPGP